MTNTSSYPLEYQHPNTSEPYWIINGQFTVELGDLALYIGCENITNFIQEDPIIAWDDPFGPYFDTHFKNNLII